MNDFTFPKDFDLAVNSILFAESIRSGSGVTALLYWASEERAFALEPRVTAALGLKAPSDLGSIVDIVTPKKPKWIETPERWGQWLVTVAAVFGALTVIQDHFRELFGRGDVVIFAGEKAPVNVHLGDTVDIPLEFRNQGRLGHVDVHISGLRFAEGDHIAKGISAQLPVTDVSQVQAGQNAEVHITGTSLPIQVSHVERCALSVDAMVKEGYFWPARKAKNIPFDISLWPDKAYEFEIKKTSDSTVQINISVGSGLILEKGLSGMVVIESSAAPIQDAITLSNRGSMTDAPIVISDGSKFVAKVLFQTGRLEPFHMLPVTLTVPFANPITDQQWSDLKSSLKVRVI